MIFAQSRFAHYAVPLFIILTTLALHVTHLGVFVAGDEVDFWIPRSERFLEALQSGDYADTAISSHPGVTTMWLGSAGIVLRQTLRDWGMVPHTPFPTLLALMRLPVALTHVLGMVLGYRLLLRLFPRPLANLALLLWATDPFIIAFNRFLHVDALTGTFATLSVLSACVFCIEPPRHQERQDVKKRMGKSLFMLVASGVCGGLAILSKTPGLAVVPIVGLLILAHAAKTQSSHTTKNTEDTERTQKKAFIGIQVDINSVWGYSVAMLLWGFVCSVTIALCWPAVWTDIAGVWQMLRVGVEVEGGSPHMSGNFFLGQHIDAPGPLFYPVALAMRTTPWALVGVLLVPFAMHTARRHPTSPIANIHWRTIATLAGFVLLFVVGLSIFPKKFNRYLVPAFPCLDILAAVGLFWVAQRLQHWRHHLAHRLQHTLFVLLIGISIVNAAWWHPYSIAYFNQLLGGAQAGAQTFVVGWGEGYKQVADYLNQQPDITGVVTASQWVTSLNPYLRHGAQASYANGDTLPDKTGYVVVYIRHVLGGKPPLPPFDQFYHRVPPIHTVTMHGVDYAWIYDVPQPLTHVVHADFGSAIRLHSYELDTADVRATGIATVTVQWYATQPIAEQYALFVHVFNAQGELVGQTDVPPAGPAMPTNTWQQYQYIPWNHPVPVQVADTSGQYWVSLGLYHPKTFERLSVVVLQQEQQGVQESRAQKAPDDGPHVLFLEPVVIE